MPSFGAAAPAPDSPQRQPAEGVAPAGFSAAEPPVQAAPPAFLPPPLIFQPPEVTAAPAAAGPAAAGTGTADGEPAETAAADWRRLRPGGRVIR